MQDTRPNFGAVLSRIVNDDAFADASEVALRQQLIHGVLTPTVTVMIESTPEREHKLQKIAAAQGLAIADTGPGFADRYVLSLPEQP